MRAWLQCPSERVALARTRRRRRHALVGSFQLEKYRDAAAPYTPLASVRAACRGELRATPATLRAIAAGESVDVQRTGVCGGAR